MITGLLIAALLLTALLALALPFGGWGRDMDAAGKGMAMFFPSIFMAVRIACFGLAVVMLAVRGELAWMGLPTVAAALLALLVTAGMGASSFTAASLVASQPGAYGRGTYAFLATIVAPVILAICLFAETYDADEGQAWIMRVLVLVAAIGPLPLLNAIRRHDAETRALADAAERAEDEAAAAYAARLPADASLLETLAFHDAIPDAMWKARGPVLARVSTMPDWKQAYLAALTSGTWDDKIRVGFHASALSPTADAAYYAAVLPVLETVIAHVEAGTEPVDVLVREVSAAIRLAWPAIHNTNLPRALMTRLHAAVERQAAAMPPLGNYTHDVKMLAEYVNG
ncbi:MAG: hypothetical protein IT548_15900 [Alphaproteobacteria bacterium]|nr:hypothetical protein [Alphaproteobacteria bacterium]